MKLRHSGLPNQRQWVLPDPCFAQYLSPRLGLFGLAAFMATQRTREIGIRKVLGVNSLQIARLLVWQFSKPVMWALLGALPAAWFASKSYLEFFADRIDTPIMILLVSGLIAVLLAWGTEAGHAWRISRSSPILALRYE